TQKLSGTVRSTARCRRLRAWPMPSSCLPEAMAVSIGHYPEVRIMPSWWRDALRGWRFGSVCSA
ncbi:hypothetical protein, partial [Mycobacterium sp.]|uniref:hypothetical protein n=1 Tax=Mycobacterium sp. TaxID=1785 RepID=UPI003C74A1A6